MKQIINGQIFDTGTSVLIGEREERGSFMYKTMEGDYFIYHSIIQATTSPCINPISRNEAIRRHFRYTINQITFKDAFGE